MLLGGFERFGGTAGVPRWGPIGQKLDLRLGRWHSRFTDKKCQRCQG